MINSIVFLLRYIQGFPTCIAAYPEGQFIECNGNKFVCAQVNGEANYYGDILLQLDLVIEQFKLPSNMHHECPSLGGNVIKKPKCGWRILYAGQYCDDSISKGIILLML